MLMNVCHCLVKQGARGQDSEYRALHNSQGPACNVGLPITQQWTNGPVNASTEAASSQAEMAQHIRQLAAWHRADRVEEKN